MTGTIVAQLFVVLTLVLMIIGKTPMYVTAVVGSTLAALFAGIPLFELVIISEEALELLLRLPPLPEASV